MAELDKILIQTHSDVILEECPKLIAGNEVQSESINPLCLIPILPYFHTSELNLMYHLMDRILNGVDPMLKFLESHIINTGLSDMKAHAEIITTVSGCGLGVVCCLILSYKIFEFFLNI